MCINMLYVCSSLPCDKACRCCSHWFSCICACMYVCLYSYIEFDWCIMYIYMNIWMHLYTICIHINTLLNYLYVYIYYVHEYRMCELITLMWQSVPVLLGLFSGICACTYVLMHVYINRLKMLIDCEHMYKYLIFTYTTLTWQSAPSLRVSMLRHLCMYVCMCIFMRVCTYGGIFVCMYMCMHILNSVIHCKYMYEHIIDTGWRRLIRCLIFIGHFLQKSPVISGPFAKNDLKLKAS